LAVAEQAALAMLQAAALRGQPLLPDQIAFLPLLPLMAAAEAECIGITPQHQWAALAALAADAALDQPDHSLLVVRLRKATATD